MYENHMHRIVQSVKYLKWIIRIISNRKQKKKTAKNKMKQFLLQVAGKEDWEKRKKK